MNLRMGVVCALTNDQQDVAHLGPRVSRSCHLAVMLCLSMRVGVCSGQSCRRPEAEGKTPDRIEGGSRAERRVSGSET